MDEDKRAAGRPRIYTGEQRQTEKIRERHSETRRMERVGTVRQPSDMQQSGAQRMERRSQEGQKRAGQPAQEGQKRAGQPMQEDQKRVGQPMQERQKRTGQPAQEDQKRAGQPTQEGQKRADQPMQERRKHTDGRKKQDGQQLGQPQLERVRRQEVRSKQQTPPRRVYVSERRERDHENERQLRFLSGVLAVLIVLLITAFIYEIVLGNGTKKTGKERMVENGQIEILDDSSDRAEKKDGGKKNAAKDEGSADKKTAEGGTAVPDSEMMKQAQFMATQYDYDGAIELLKSAQGYESNAEYQAEVGKLEEQKAACVAYPADEVTHIFFHTLIHDAAKAFDGDEYEDGYNQFMVTEYEFKSIIQQMYDRGYVMVFLDDLAPGTVDGSGNKTFAKQDILLPEGKIPFVLSQDDVSYYHYMDGDGYASRLILDENGDVKNEYIEDDGSVSVGDYDMVPIIDTFVKEHPDFSYRGAKGYIALTGYEGILGYRTDEVYKTKEEGRVTIQQQQFFDSYPGGFDEAAFEKECEGAKKVADAMKANGWRFASHTWGHQNMSETDGISYDSFVRDTDRWETWVEPLIGETDTLIYAFGGDIRGMEKYSGERFEYFKQCGFDYFCGVDSAKYWLQVEPNYVRQSRRNVDGYRMYYNPEMLEDLFDVQKAWDPLRPDSVPPI